MGYHDFGTKFSPSLTITNLHLGTCGTHKLSYSISSEFSQYTCLRSLLFIIVLRIFKKKILILFYIINILTKLIILYFFFLNLISKTYNLKLLKLFIVSLSFSVIFQNSSLTINERSFNFYYYTF
jgi:uncharacterized membrane protein